VPVFRRLRFCSCRGLCFGGLRTISTSLDPDVDEQMLDRNAACLMQSYIDRRLDKSIDAIFLIGLPRRVPRVSQGGSMQAETQHYVCVLSGLAAVNMLTRESAAMLCGEDPRGFYSYQLETSPLKRH